MPQQNPIHIIGAGLAGSEAAWQIATLGIPVILHEMRPKRMTNAHQTEKCAELVCSNSFRSDDHETNAVGVLHEEMRYCNSLIMKAADASRVPAGSALAVDREHFASSINQALIDSPNITIDRNEVKKLHENWNTIIVATGPLTSDHLANTIRSLTGKTSLAFFDAIAPIVYKESIDFSKAWFQSRYDKGIKNNISADYINCALDKDEYQDFVKALIKSETVEFKEWEKNTPYFEGCMPVEEIARRGLDTLRFGPMKPVGLTNPKTNMRPHAVVQLRQDNSMGTLYNMVGFQTKAKHKSQLDIFRMIPGLETAEFARLGGLHRNTFIKSPELLDRHLRLKKDLRIRFAGQITGVEGYLESAAIGLLAGRFSAWERLGKPIIMPPRTTALGSLIQYITGGAETSSFQPMNINFGLFPPIIPETGTMENPRVLKGRERKKALAKRALQDLNQWVTRSEENVTNL